MLNIDSLVRSFNGLVSLSLGSISFFPLNFPPMTLINQ